MTWLAILRRVWPAIAVLLLGIWAARLDHLRAGYRADLTACQSARKLDRANAERDSAKAEAGWARQQIDASAAQAAREASRQPIVIRSTDTVREYAQTDAGRAVCRGADRVRSIDALDADLAAATRSARLGADPVRADASAPPAGR